MKVRLFIDNWNCGIITVSLKQAKKLAELKRQIELNYTEFIY